MRGRKGVEGFYNRYLAGFPGERFLRVDARGFRPRKSAGKELAAAAADDVAPADGLDLEDAAGGEERGDNQDEYTFHFLLLFIHYFLITRTVMPSTVTV